jgi:anti-sigma B factor antagonist
VFMDICSAITSGIGVVVADLTDTRFCDCSGIREISHAWRCAMEAGVELKFVIPPGPVLRVVKLTGLDQVWQPYPTLRAAMDQAPRGLERAGFRRKRRGPHS